MCVLLFSREPKKKGDVAMAVEEDKSSAAGSSIPFAAHSATKMVSLMVDKRVHRFALTAVPRQTDAVLDAAKVHNIANMLLLCIDTNVILYPRHRSLI